MAVTVLHRLRGGEVIKIALGGQPFDDRDQTYWGVLTDPPRPDGDVVRDLSGADPGPLRVLGFAKRWDGTDVRNATQVEIDQMLLDETEDEKDQEAEDAVRMHDTHPRFRKALKALALVTMDEINILRALHALPPRTKAQLLTAVTNKVDRED